MLQANKRAQVCRNSRSNCSLHFRSLAGQFPAQHHLITVATTLSDTREPRDGQPVPTFYHTSPETSQKLADDTNRPNSPPPQYPRSEAEASSSSPPSSPRPPPFSSLYSNASDSYYAYTQSITQAATSASVPAYAPVAPDVFRTRSLAPKLAPDSESAPSKDNKGEPSKKDDSDEPPPAYEEGDSPLLSFTYVMAAAGGAASILTQVQQGGPPINTLGGTGVILTIGTR